MLPDAAFAAPGWLALIVAGLLLAGVVKGATGLGYASTALPFLVVTLGLENGMALVLAPAMATNVWIALGGGRLRATCGAFWPLYLAMLPGVAAGLALLAVVEARIAAPALGAIIVAYALWALLRPPLRLPMVTAQRLRVPAGLVSGLLTGLTGSQVMPLVPYVMAVRLSPDEAVQAISLGVLLASLALAVGLVTSGTVPPGLVVLSLAATVPALVGSEMGRRLRPLVPEARFRQLVLVVLMASGVAMLAR